MATYGKHNSVCDKRSVVKPSGTLKMTNIIISEIAMMISGDIIKTDRDP